VTRARILVLGAGPAGLAAATRLLEAAPERVAVKLVHMGHHLGGKAASYRDASGRLVEHGWHMILGFYARLRALMARAGISERDTLASMGGQSHPFESWSGRVHTLSSARSRVEFAARFARYDGLPVDDRSNYSRFMSQAYLTCFSGADLTRHDDLCFNTYAVEHGLRPHVTRYSLFRFLREAYFNFPEQISAYHALASMRLMSSHEQAEAFVVRGGYSERLWDPIARYFEGLGGTIEGYVLATDFVYAGRKITGVRVASPDPAGHHGGAGPWTTGAVLPLAGSERVLDGFDEVICAIPHAVLLSMNRRDERWWGSSYFSRLKNLRSAATVSMTVLTRRKALPFPGPVFGLPAPLGIAVNMTPYWDEYRNHGQVGSAIAFVGQEAGFEDWTDEQIASFTLDNFSRLKQVGDLRAAEILGLELHRNRADFERLLLCEPGVQQFRPGSLTPFTNLFLAGDWVRNEVDLICMEGAVAAGHAAAAQALAALGAS
jgi:uncharacterized protein with NAD-binding domain and iron-sulfur cluster